MFNYSGRSLGNFVRRLGNFAGPGKGSARYPRLVLIRIAVKVYVPENPKSKSQNEARPDSFASQFSAGRTLPTYLHTTSLFNTNK